MHKHVARALVVRMILNSVSATQLARGNSDSIWTIGQILFRVSAWKLSLTCMYVDNLLLIILGSLNTFVMS